jgi:hypothetical protein
MKKTIVVLAAAAALALTAAAPASAGSCRTVKCFNKQISVLNSEVGQLASALNCLHPVAVTRYGGYDYNGVAGATTALDLTESGDGVGTWVVAIEPGTCGAPQTRTAAASAPRSSAPAARDASPFGPFGAIPGTAERRP